MTGYEIVADYLTKEYRRQTMLPFKFFDKMYDCLTFKNNVFYPTESKTGNRLYSNRKYRPIRIDEAIKTVYKLLSDDEKLIVMADVLSKRNE